MHTLLYYSVCVNEMCACVYVCTFVCDMRDRERESCQKLSIVYLLLWSLLRGATWIQ